MSTMTASTIDFLGARARILLGGEDTGGTLALTDMLDLPAGDMPPLHVHHAHDEWFCVLDGSVTFYMPGREVPLEAGDSLFAPRGVPHTYRVGEQPARWIAGSTPAGFEQFVAEVAALDELDPASLTGVAAKHGIEILGPPGMLP